MAVEKINLKISSGLDRVYRSGRAFSDNAPLNPLHATAYLDGEWFVQASDGKTMSRAAAIGTLGTAGAGGRATSARCVQLFMELGNTTVQSMPEPKAAFLYLGSYEAETLIFDPTAVVASGAAITAVDQPLKVATISITTNGVARNYVGLVGHGGAGTDAAPIAAYVSQLSTDNGGWLKYVKVA